MTELIDKIGLLIDAMLENQPRLTSDRFNGANSDTLIANTQLTVTFTLSKDFVVRLVKAYCDVRSGCTYQWIIDGQVYNINSVEFYLGKPLHQDVKLIVANTSAVTVSIGYYIMGWADQKAGG